MEEEAMEILLAFLGWFFGAIATILITIWVERLRSPRLKLVIGPAREFVPSASFKAKWRLLKVEVSNESLPSWGNWLLRLPAQQCRADIAFLRTDGTDIFDKPMTARWSGAPEPRVSYVSGAAVLTNPQELKSTVDISPGESQLVDVAVRVEGEDDLYGWNDESYFYEDFRNTNWRLGKNNYLVKVTVLSSGRKGFGKFRLLNDGPFNTFRLV
jgi:hypothetical protein